MFGSISQLPHYYTDVKHFHAYVVIIDDMNAHISTFYLLLSTY